MLPRKRADRRERRALDRRARALRDPDPLLGTNPIAFGFPLEGDPLVIRWSDPQVRGAQARWVASPDHPWGQTRAEHDAMLHRYSDLQDRFRMHDGYTIELKTGTVLQGAGVEFLAPPFSPPWGGHRFFLRDQIAVRS